MKRLWHEEEGQDLVEYGLLMILIGLFLVAAMGHLANGISTMFSTVATNITNS